MTHACRNWLPESSAKRENSAKSEKSAKSSVRSAKSLKGEDCCKIVGEMKEVSIGADAKRLRTEDFVLRTYLSS